MAGLLNVLRRWVTVSPGSQSSPSGESRPQASSITVVCPASPTSPVASHIGELPRKPIVDKSWSNHKFTVREPRGYLETLAFQRYGATEQVQGLLQYARDYATRQASRRTTILRRPIQDEEYAVQYKFLLPFGHEVPSKIAKNSYGWIMNTMHDLFHPLGDRASYYVWYSGVQSPYSFGVGQTYRCDGVLAAPNDNPDLEEGPIAIDQWWIHEDDKDEDPMFRNIAIERAYCEERGLPLPAFPPPYLEYNDPPVVPSPPRFHAIDRFNYARGRGDCETSELVGHWLVPFKPREAAEEAYEEVEAASSADGESAIAQSEAERSRSGAHYDGSPEGCDPGADADADAEDEGDHQDGYKDNAYSVVDEVDSQNKTEPDCGIKPEDDVGPENICEALSEAEQTRPSDDTSDEGKSRKDIEEPCSYNSIEGSGQSLRDDDEEAVGQAVDENSCSSEQAVLDLVHSDESAQDADTIPPALPGPSSADTGLAGSDTAVSNRGVASDDIRAPRSYSSDDSSTQLSDKESEDSFGYYESAGESSLAALGITGLSLRVSEKGDSIWDMSPKSSSDESENDGGCPRYQPLSSWSPSSSEDDDEEEDDDGSGTPTWTTLPCVPNAPVRGHEDDDEKKDMFIPLAPPFEPTTNAGRQHLRTIRHLLDMPPQTNYLEIQEFLRRHELVRVIFLGRIPGSAIYDPGTQRIFERLCSDTGLAEELFAAMNELVWTEARILDRIDDSRHVTAGTELPMNEGATMRFKAYPFPNDVIRSGAARAPREQYLFVQDYEDGTGGVLRVASAQHVPLARSKLRNFVSADSPDESARRSEEEEEVGKKF